MSFRQNRSGTTPTATPGSSTDTSPDSSPRREISGPVSDEHKTNFFTDNANTEISQTILNAIKIKIDKDEKNSDITKKLTTLSNTLTNISKNMDTETYSKHVINQFGKDFLEAYFDDRYKFLKESKFKDYAKALLNIVKDLPENTVLTKHKGSITKSELDSQILITFGSENPKLAAQQVFNRVMTDCLPFFAEKNTAAKLRFVNCMKAMSRLGNTTQGEFNKLIDSVIGEKGKFLYYSDQRLGKEKLAEAFFDELKKEKVDGALTAYTNNPANRAAPRAN